MITNMLTGTFQVHTWDNSKKEWSSKLKADDEQIQFSCSLTQPIEGLESSEYKKEDGSIRYIHRFKIGKNCRWFDGATKAEMPRPTNSSLDGKRWNAFLDCRKVESKGAMTPSGNWVNAIILTEVKVNPFEGVNFDNLAVSTPSAPSAPSASAESAVPTPSAPQSDKEEELPF